MKLSKVYKAKTYEEAKKLCPKGYRMPEIWELVKLACENNKIIFETEKDKWIFFWSGTIYRNTSVPRLSRGRYGYWVAYWYGLALSLDAGRVVYVKIEKGDKT
jgi:hypothetical protein